MKDERKTKEQLINELMELRRRTAELEALETERKRAEEALRASENQYRTLFEKSPDSITLVDKSGVVIDCNKSTEELIGYSKQEIVGKPFEKLLTLDPKDLPRLKEQYEKLSQGLEVEPYDLEIIRKDGKRRWINVTNSLLMRDDVVVGFQIISRDVTERKRAEEALAKAEGEKETILDSLVEHVVHEDMEMKILWANRAACESVNLAREELIGHHCYEIWPKRSELCPDCPVVKAIETGQPQEVEKKTPDGRAWFIRGYPVRDEKGDIVGGVEVTLDITERKRAEEALRESEARHRLHFENVSDVIYSINPELKLIDISPSVERVLGYKPEELIGRPFQELNVLAPAYLEQAFSDAMRVLGGERITAAVYQFIARDGTEKWGEVSGAPLVRDGQVVSVISVARDITARKRAEEALRESEEELRAIFDNVGDGIALIDVTGRVLRVNRRITDVGGYAEEEIVGKRFEFFKMFPPRSLAKMLSNFTKLISGQHTPPFEVEVYTRAGEKMSVELRGSLLRKGGKTMGIVGVMRDITERKLAEEALRESEEKFRTFTESAPVAIMIYQNYQYIYANPEAEQITGYTREELSSMKFSDFVHPDYKDVVIESGKALERGESSASRQELEIITKNGHKKWIDGRLELIEYEGKRAALISVMDITERKQLEAQLLQLQKMEAIGQLAAGIAHDFNNLLTPMGGFADLLLGRIPEGSKEREYLHQIKVAAERAADLTNQLRIFTRQARGERHPVQLNNVVEETRHLLERSIPKEITIELDLESELWAVQAAPSQISQVLVNLCINARDAMPEGGTLTLETRNVTLDEEYARTVLEARPGRYVRLSVSDTGCGMSPEVQARLFEPFFTTKGMGEGAGLGLAMVYGIVKGHEGFVQVYSEEGQGSTFQVYLPAIEVAVEEGEAERLEWPTGIETILVVDDEDGVRKLGQAVLEPCGYTVLLAEDGVQALEVYQGHRGEIALVVLDVIMPRMSGLECLRRLREMDPQVKVLISTGYTAKGVAQELVAEGALGVVEKPFRIQDFATAVRAAIDEDPKGFKNP
jgi:PAS domain S-box-containing protein